MKAPYSMGFGLLELMVTVAVIAILAVISFPSFDRFFSAGRLEGALQEVNAVLNLAKTTAISRSNPVSVVFKSGDAWCVVAVTGTTNRAMLFHGAVTSVDPVSSCTCLPDCSSCSIGCGVIGLVKATDHEKVQLNASMTEYVIDPANGIVSTPGQIELRSGSRSGTISVNKLGKAWICNKGEISC